MTSEMSDLQAVRLRLEKVERNKRAPYIWVLGNSLVGQGGRTRAGQSCDCPQRPLHPFGVSSKGIA